MGALTRAQAQLIGSAAGPFPGGHGSRSITAKLRASHSRSLEQHRLGLEDHLACRDERLAHAEKESIGRGAIGLANFPRAAARIEETSKNRPADVK
jgi:hypothetical protein